MGSRAILGILPGDSVLAPTQVFFRSMSFGRTRNVGRSAPRVFWEVRPFAAWKSCTASFFPVYGRLPVWICIVLLFGEDVYSKMVSSLTFEGPGQQYKPVDGHRIEACCMLYKKLYKPFNTCFNSADRKSKPMNPKTAAQSAQILMYRPFETVKSHESLLHECLKSLRKLDQRQP